MKTTAQLRTEARELEAKLQWKAAAEAWDQAIKAYPRSLNSALAQRDIELMTESRDGCLMMVEAA